MTGTCCSSIWFAAIVFCSLISVNNVVHSQSDEDIEQQQYFDIQRVATGHNNERLMEADTTSSSSVNNQVQTDRAPISNVRSRKQFYEINADNPFLHADKTVIRKQQKQQQQKQQHMNNAMYSINPNNPFLQQFLAHSVIDIRMGGDVNVATTQRPRRTTTQRVMTTSSSRSTSRITTTSRRPASRRTTTTQRPSTTTLRPSTTTYKQIPGLMLYLSPTIEENRKKYQQQQQQHNGHQHMQHLYTSSSALRTTSQRSGSNRRSTISPDTPRPELDIRGPLRTTNSPIIGSFLPKTKSHIDQVFHRTLDIEWERAVSAPVLESSVEFEERYRQVEDDQDIEDLFENFDLMRLKPKLQVSSVLE